MPIALVAFVYYDQKFVVHHRASNLIDVNWNNGIGRQWAGFIFNNSNENLDLFEIGGKVKFVTGDIREIINIYKGVSFINIYLNGEPLDGQQVGYPNDIVIVK
jgi:hypothetical protein